MNTRDNLKRAPQQQREQNMRRENPMDGFRVPPREKIQSYIAKDDTAREMIQFAEKFGQKYKKDITTSQIRNAYGNMKKLEMAGWQDAHTQRKVLLLKPRLAYAAGRHRGDGLENLRTIMDSAIDAVTDEASFGRFCQFFEAIVAYHKAAGGK